MSPTARKGGGSRTPRAVLKELRALCLALPEALETETFGNPTWQAGDKRTFCVLDEYDGELVVSFKASPAEQAQLLLHPKFKKAPYSGKHGWTLLRVGQGVDARQLAPLIEASYRLVALKRMVKRLEHLRLPRCRWPSGERMIDYHDQEWGRPLHDDRKLFEALLLDSAQAGLSWQTILNRREGYRKAYRDFDPVKIARFGKRDETRLLGDAGIIRNRQKIEASIRNAGLFLELQREHGSFDEWLWSFVDGEPVVGHWRETSQLPAKTELSDEVSRALKKRGFGFVGSVTIYAFLQAVGVVNDHLQSCYCYAPERA